MPTFDKSSPFPVDAATLFAWHARPGALRRLLPPWQAVRIVEDAASIRDGSRVVMDMRLAPFIWKRWVAEHFDFVDGERFRDRALRGPFKSWTHTHRTIAKPGGTSVLNDHVDYEVPLGAIGRAVGGARIDGDLERMFAFRHARTLNDLIRHSDFADRRPLTVAVSGASGAVAQRLMPLLTTGGHSVRRLVRTASSDADAIRWDANTGNVDLDRLGGCDAIVHLAGKNIATRWTDARKAEFRRSRVDATRGLCETLARMPADRRPSVLVCASAAGIYGDRGEERLDESSPPGDLWISKLCVDWEAATQPARDAGIRVVNLRIAAVLAADSGALSMMLAPARLGLAGRMGSGRQWMPWIAMDDLTYMIHAALLNGAWAGPINALTTSTRQRELIDTIGQVLHRPTIAPMPAAVATTLLGEMAREVLLTSQNAQPKRARELGFTPTFPTLESVLRFELGKAGLPIA